MTEEIQEVTIDLIREMRKRGLSLEADLLHQEYLNKKAKQKQQLQKELKNQSMKKERMWMAKNEGIPYHPRISIPLTEEEKRIKKHEYGIKRYSQIKNDPERYKKYLESQRLIASKRWQKIKSDPIKHEIYKRKVRQYMRLRQCSTK